MADIAYFVDSVIVGAFKGKDIVAKMPGAGFFRVTIVDVVGGGFKVRCYNKDGSTFEKWITYNQARNWFESDEQVAKLNEGRKAQKTQKAQAYAASMASMDESDESDESEGDDEDSGEDVEEDDSL